MSKSNEGVDDDKLIQPPHKIYQVPSLCGVRQVGYCMQTSISRKGNCWDNAPMEGFFGTIGTGNLIIVLKSEKPLKG